MWELLGIVMNNTLLYYKCIIRSFFQSVFIIKNTKITKKNTLKQMNKCAPCGDSILKLKYVVEESVKKGLSCVCIYYYI